jgi:peptide/nickel transport system permease protein
MITYMIRRLGMAAIVVLFVTVIVFILVHHLPGGPCRALLGPRATPVSCRAFDQQEGLNLPLPVQYWDWVKGLIIGYPGNTCPGNCHLGFSYRFDQSVDSLLATYLPRSIILVGMSTLLALVVAIPLGLLQAVRRNRPVDYVLTGGSFVGYSMPTFFLGIVLIDVFADRLGVLPPEAPQGSWESAFSQPNAMILPVLTLSVVTIAAFSRYQRSATLENLAQDYVRTARAKGLSERRILFGHVLRNSLMPVVTLLGLSLPVVLSGALMTEVVFNYPGMGLLFWQAATSQDYPVLMGVTLVVGIATVAGNLLADIGYAVLDPRVRYT